MENVSSLVPILREALSRPPAERAAFVEEVSAGDHDLRRSLARLLADETQARRMVEGDRLPAGTLLGGYRIEAPLGRGGMGELYVARDTRVGRRVALKMLPRHVAGDPEIVGRFHREALAASALNHPNILTLHDVGEHEGRPFMACELVEGRSLRDELRAGRPSLGRALGAIAQVASALAAAHDAGIVHRDIKPENVMVRNDGYVKVLDFGLARLDGFERDPVGAGSTGPAASLFESRSGAVLGTVHYMSPEQARGERVDARSDLFSLGVVLYELVTGRRPFDGATVSEVLLAIREHEPPPIAERVAKAPRALERILERCLEKDPARRFASARELERALRRLVEELERGARLPRWAVVGIAAALGVALIVVAVAVRWGRGRRDPGGAGRPSRERVEMKQITSTGNALMAAISPDGGQVAYVLYGPGGAGLFVRDLGSGRSRRLLATRPVSFWDLTFSADSSSVIYVTEDPRRPVGGNLYRLTLSDRPPELLLVGVVAVRESKDGRRLLLRRRDPVAGGTELLVVDRDGGNRRTVASDGGGWTLVASTWSDSSDAVVYARGGEDAAGDYWDLVERRWPNGPERILLARERRSIRGIAAVPGGGGMVLSLEDERSGKRQLWHLAAGADAPRPLTRDLNDYGVPMLSADGRALVTVQQSRPARIWVGPVADRRVAEPIIDGTGEYGELALAPDGRLVYVLSADAERNLWSVDPPDGEPRQLTRNARINYMPDVCPDGSIVFVSTRSGSQRIWRIDADGAHPRRLGDNNIPPPECSPDGRTVVYQRRGATGWEIARIPIDGGRPELLVAEEAVHPTLSPDGRWIAYQRIDADPRVARLVVRPVAGGPLRATFEARSGYDRPRWTPDGSGLLYLDAAVHGRMLFQPLGGGPPVVWLDWPHETMFAFALSPDARSFAFTSGQFTTEAILFRNLL